MDRPDIVVTLALLVHTNVTRLEEILGAHQEGGVSRGEIFTLGPGVCLGRPTTAILVGAHRGGGHVVVSNVRHPNVDGRGSPADGTLDLVGRRGARALLLRTTTRFLLYGNIIGISLLLLLVFLAFAHCEEYVRRRG